MAHCNSDINIDEIKPHFLYKNYGSYCQEIINIKKMKLLKGLISKQGYRHVGIRYEGITIGYLYHRFIYECNNGVIPNGYVDNDKLNNNVNNLQVITQSQNSKKNYKQRSYIPRPVRAICLETGFIQDFKSQSFAGQILNINPGSVKRVCDGITNTAISKITGYRYYFHYCL